MARLSTVLRNVARAAIVATALLVPSFAMALNANVTAQVIEASNDGSGVDAALTSLMPPLTVQFSQYDSFHLSATHVLTLDEAAPTSVPGTDLHVEFVGIETGQYVFQISNNGDSPMQVRLPPGGMFSYLGPASAGGRTILTLRVAR